MNWEILASLYVGVAIGLTTTTTFFWWREDYKVSPHAVALFAILGLCWPATIVGVALINIFED